MGRRSTRIGTRTRPVACHTAPTRRGTPLGTTTGIEAFVAERRADLLRIAREHGALRVRVFGSVERGGSGAESDLDLPIGMEPGHGRLAIVAIGHGVGDVLGRQVHVSTEAVIGPSIRDAILHETPPPRYGLRPMAVASASSGAHPPG